MVWPRYFNNMERTACRSGPADEAAHPARYQVGGGVSRLLQFDAVIALGDLGYVARRFNGDAAVLPLGVGR